MLCLARLMCLLKRSREEQLHKQIGFNYQKERYTSANVFLLAPTWIYYKILICLLNFGPIIQLFGPVIQFNIWQWPCIYMQSPWGKS